MRLLVGLGNPGPEYARNRHNLGFMAVDEIVHRHGFGPWRRRFQGRVAEGALGHGRHRVLALEPLVYMNLSGQSVSAALAFFKLPPADLIVVHDELDLPPGKVRVKQGGSAGGHNGLRSIDEHIGQDYWRVRLGVGHPGDKDLVQRYLLHDFAKADRLWIEPLLDAVASAFPLIVEGEPDRFMTKVALLTQPVA